MRYPDCLCGARDYKLYHYAAKEKDIDIIECRRCHLARTWPTPLAGSELKSFYDVQDDYEMRFEQLPLWQSFARRTLDIIRRYRPSGKLLEVGCNLGIFVKEALDRGYDAHGIDLAEVPLKHGEARLGLAGRLTAGSLASLQYPENSWDVIAYIHTFEHLENPEAEMREARRVLSADGILVIEVPRFFSAWRVLLGRHWYGFSPYQHIWQCGKRGVTALLERSGFEIVASKTRTSMHHEITPDLKGMVKQLIHGIAWLTGTGDNLIIIARKR